MGTAPPFTQFKQPKQLEHVSYTPPSALSTAEINLMLHQIEANCKAQKDQLTLCTTEESCGAAAVALQRCSAMIVCPTIAKEFDSLVTTLSARKSEGGEESVPDEELSRSFQAMTGCMEHFAVACFNATDDPDDDEKK